MSSEVPEPKTPTLSTLETRVRSNPQASRPAILPPSRSRFSTKKRGNVPSWFFVRPIASTPVLPRQRGTHWGTGGSRDEAAVVADAGPNRRALDAPTFRCPMSHVPHAALENWMLAQLWNRRLLLKILCVGHRRLQPDQGQQNSWPPRRWWVVACRPFTSPPWPQILHRITKIQTARKREATLASLNPKRNVQRANLAGRAAFLRLKWRDGKSWSAIVSGASCMGRRLPPARLSTASRWTASTLDKLGGAVFSAGLVPPPDSPQLDRCS